MPKSTRLLTAYCLLITVYCLLFTIPSSLAQGETTAVQFLGVEIWPDYDQPAVLILFTGTLAPDTPLPTTVTLPLPASAQLNAVARITTDGIMVDDIPFNQEANTVTLTTPDLQFRVEYYVPYATEGNGRSYTFLWQSALDIAQMTVSVQQPAAASSIEIQPTAVNVANDRSDGLLYHNLPTIPVSPNQPYEVMIAYELTEPQLSVAIPASGQAPPAAVVTPDTTASTLNTYFILAILSAVFVIGYVGWHMVKQQRLSTRQRRTRKPKKKQPARFCHHCGQKTARDDKFCRHCGKKLKEATD